MKKLLQSTAFKWIAKIGFFLFLIAAVLLIARALLIDYIADTPRMIMSDAEYEEMHSFFSTPVQLNESVYQVEPYPADLIEDASKFHTVLLNKSDFLADKWFEYDGPALHSALISGASFSPKQIQDAKVLVREYDPLLQALQKMVEHPEYDLTILHMLNTPPVELPAFLLEVATKVIHLKGYINDTNVRKDKAFACVLTALRLLKHHPHSQILIQVWADGMAIDSLYIITRLSRNCEDIDLLEDVLNKLSQLDSGLFHTTLKKPFMTDIIGTLRIGKQVNYPIKFETGMNAHDLFEQYKYAKITELRSYDGQKLTLEQFRLTVAQNQDHTFFQNNIFLWDIIKKFQQIRAKDRTSEEFLSVQYYCDEFIVVSKSIWLAKPVAELQYKAINDFYKKEKVTESSLIRQTRFHLTQIALAQRIAVLKRETGPGQRPELVPEYFESDLIDPFSGKPYLWDVDNECFYGVGPDKEDNQNSLTYDPTNGVISAGDISIP